MPKVAAKNKAWGYVRQKGSRYYLYREIGMESGKRRYAPSLIYSDERLAFDELQTHKSIMQRYLCRPGDVAVKAYIEATIGQTKKMQSKCSTIRYGIWCWRNGWAH